MAVKDIMRALGGGGSLALVVDAAVGTGKLALVLGEFLFGNVDMLLALFAALSGHIAPRVDWLPAGAVNKVVLGLATLYVLVIVGRLAKRWNDER